MGLEECLKDVKIWMFKNRLQMNNGKTEFIYFGSRQMLPLCNAEQIDVQCSKISRSKIVRYLGALLDSELNLKKHVMTVCAKSNEEYQQDYANQKFFKSRGLVKLYYKL